MPVMNGMDSTHAIRMIENERNLKAVPIVGLSANTRKEYVDKAIAVGMNGYITKPYIKTDIYAIIDNLVFGVNESYFFSFRLC